MEDSARTLPDDVVLEVLARVSDVAALFRFATAAKRWRGLIGDRSFLSRRWPENSTHPSFLIGFFTQRLCHGSGDGESPFIEECGADRESPPVFVPSPRSVLGPGLRSLPSGLLDGAKPLTARLGLLLVRLAPKLSRSPIRLAVCDLLAGTCDVLPPLHCDRRWTPSNYAILTGQDCHPHSADKHKPRSATPNYSRFFKVLAIGFTGNAYRGDDVEYSLSLFSSAEPGWATPAKRSSDDLRIGGPEYYPYLQDDATVCRHGMAHWLCSDLWLPMDDSPNYFTIGVNPEDGHVSFAKLSFLENQLTAHIYQLATVDGTLMLFLLYTGIEDLWLDTWTCTGGTQWHRTLVTMLKPPEHRRIESVIYFWSGEKSGTLFIIDSNMYMYLVYLETGAMEEVSSQFRGMIGEAVPMEIDWPELFMSRLAGGSPMEMA